MSSIAAVQRATRLSWRVRWTSADGKKMSRSFTSEAAARTFMADLGDEEIRRRYGPIPRTTEQAITYLVEHIELDRSGCWLWTAGLTDDGYPRLTWRRPGQPPEYGAHRVSHVVFNGEIPAGMHVDHTCHNVDPTCPGGVCRHRSCVNPAHVEAVVPVLNVRRSPHTVATINARKTHCPQGHPYTTENLYPGGQGRNCKTCVTARNRGQAASR